MAEPGMTRGLHRYFFLFFRFLQSFQSSVVHLLQAVCRHELPSEQASSESRVAGQIEEEAVGLTIWRLPGGGFAVGRFAGESHLPVVYTEMENGGNLSEGSRRISLSVGSGRVRESRGGIGRMFRNWFGRIGALTTSRSLSTSLFSRRRSSTRTWVLED